MILFEGNGLDLSGHTFDFSQFILDRSFYTDGMFNFVRTIQSFSNIGYQALFILAGVWAVSQITKSIFGNHIRVSAGVAKRKFKRDVEVMDIERNRKAIVNHGVLKREIGREIEAEDLRRNRDKIVDLKVRQKEVDLEVNLQFRERNRDKLVDDAVERKKLRRDVMLKYREGNNAYYQRREEEES